MNELDILTIAIIASFSITVIFNMIFTCFIIKTINDIGEVQRIISNIIIQKLSS